MREAISDDIIEFRNTSVQECVYCLKQQVDFHVDHDFPPFRTLKANFLSKFSKNLPTEFDECEKYSLKKFRKADKLFADEWKEYHKINAKLQILCASCNLKKH